MSDRAPDVSVIMAVYNGMPLVERALASLARQTIGLDRMQVLVVDDGSTDETFAVVDRWAREHPGFEAFHQANSGGPAAPRNFALERARGRYVFFLDADDYLADDALEAMVGIADANGTDVVVPRIKGMGGRTGPRSTFARTIPRTDVFSSWVYRSLNPMKMFRAELIRSVGLRFPVDFPWGEDQPFVASAYFHADGISVLADKDYIFWAFRDDGTNMTTSAVGLRDRMPVASFMFDFLAANVPPGPERDRLMHRHFTVEFLGSVCAGYRTETDPSARAAAFARLREIVGAYYNTNIEALLRPEARILALLLTEDRADDFADYLDALELAGKPGLSSEPGGVFLCLPWFRDPARGLPDRLFEIAERLAATCWVEPLEPRGAGFRFAATCRLGLLTESVTEVSLVARSRVGGADVAYPLAHTLTVGEALPLVVVDEIVPVDRLISGMPIGMQDLYLRVAAGGTCRERRVTECAPPPLAVRVVHGGRGQVGVSSAVLVTTPGGYLSLRVMKGRGRPVRLRLAYERGVRGAKSLVKAGLGRLSGR